MVKIQIDLDDNEDQIVDGFKLAKHLKTKQDAIKMMIKCFQIDFKIKLTEDEYFSTKTYFKK